VQKVQFIIYVGMLYLHNDIFLTDITASQAMTG